MIFDAATPNTTTLDTTATPARTARPTTLRSRRLVAAVATFGIAAGVIGASAGTAGAATANKAKPKPVATKTKKATKKATKTTKATTKKATTSVATGVVAAVVAKTHTLTVKVGKADERFTDGTAKVTLAGKASTAASLKAGDHVRITYQTPSKGAKVALTISATKA